MTKQKQYNKEFKQTIVDLHRLAQKLVILAANMVYLKSRFINGLRNCLLLMVQKI